MKTRVALAQTDAEIMQTYPVMRQLRPHIARGDYLARVKQQAEEGYRLAMLERDGKVAAVAGFRLSRSLVAGKFLYVDDLITDAKVRSKGAGAALFAWLVKYARRHECAALTLDSGVHRHEAHRFYLRERMDIVCYNFRLQLAEERS